MTRVPDHPLYRLDTEHTHYKLDAMHQPVPCTLLEWAMWLETSGFDRRVALSEIGDAEVSTVFIGINMRRHLGEGPPILFETMVFGGALDGAQKRYATWAEAQIGHNAMVAQVRAAHA